MEVVDDDLTYANVDSFLPRDGTIEALPNHPILRFLMTKYEPMDF